MLLETVLVVLYSRKTKLEPQRRLELERMVGSLICLAQVKLVEVRLTTSARNVRSCVAKRQQRDFGVDWFGRESVTIQVTGGRTPDDVTVADCTLPTGESAKLILVDDAHRMELIIPMETPITPPENLGHLYPADYGDGEIMAQAIEAVPRHRFLPPGSQIHAGAAQAIFIGHGQTNSLPAIVERMLRLLDVKPGQRVLDIGSGSGWTTALLAWLTGPDGIVVATEVLEDVLETGRANVAQFPFADRVHFRLAYEGYELGAADLGPYDRILVSAGADYLPDELIDQLAPGGVMVIPVRGVLTLVVNDSDGLKVVYLDDCRFVPLL
jgi:protein-L-isoaspartate(D-aspartate) O-methyltransferase